MALQDTNLVNWLVQYYGTVSWLILFFFFINLLNFFRRLHHLTFAGRDTLDAVSLPAFCQQVFLFTLSLDVKDRLPSNSTLPASFPFFVELF